MRVLNDNVMVLVEAIKQNPNSLLYIPDTVQEGQILIGTVTEVGNGKLLADGTRSPLSVNIDQQVWFLRGHAYKMDLKGQTFYVLPEHVILAVEDMYI